MEDPSFDAPASPVKMGFTPGEPLPVRVDSMGPGGPVACPHARLLLRRRDHLSLLRPLFCVKAQVQSPVSLVKGFQVEGAREDP